MPYTDALKNAEYKRKWHEDNREKARESGRRTREARKTWLNSLKDRPCEDCGGIFPPFVLDFHHRDPSQKKARISFALITMGRERVLEEIAKCGLICSNCHRIREHSRV